MKQHAAGWSSDYHSACLPRKTDLTKKTFGIRGTYDEQNERLEILSSSQTKKRIQLDGNMVLTTMLHETFSERHKKEALP